MIFITIQNCPTSGKVVALKTTRREVPGSNPCRACGPRLSEFSLVFPETRIDTGYDPLERPPLRALSVKAQVPQVDNWPYTYNKPTNQPTHSISL